MIAAPLIMGNDLRSISAESKAILLNKEVIAIDQDPLGSEGIRITDGDQQVWGRPLSDGGYAVVLYNKQDYDNADITVTFTDLGVASGTTFAVRDLFEGKDLGSFTNSYTGNAQAHGV